MKEKEQLVIRSKDFEKQIAELKQKHKMELSRILKQGQKELQLKQQEIEKLNHVTVEKKKLEAKLKWTQEQLQRTGVRVDSARNLAVPETHQSD